MYLYFLLGPARQLLTKLYRNLSTHLATPRARVAFPCIMARVQFSGLFLVTLLASWAQAAQQYADNDRDVFPVTKNSAGNYLRLISEDYNAFNDPNIKNTNHPGENSNGYSDDRERQSHGRSQGSTKPYWEERGFEFQYGEPRIVYSEARPYNRAAELGPVKQDFDESVLTKDVDLFSTWPSKFSQDPHFYEAVAEEVDGRKFEDDHRPEPCTVTEVVTTTYFVRPRPIVTEYTTSTVLVKCPEPTPTQHYRYHPPPFPYYHERPFYEQPALPPNIPCDICEYPHKCDYCPRPAPRPTKSLYHHDRESCELCQHPKKCDHCPRPPKPPQPSQEPCEHCQPPKKCEHCGKTLPLQAAQKRSIELYTSCEACTWPDNCDHCHDQKADPEPKLNNDQKEEHNQGEYPPCDQCHYPNKCNHCQAYHNKHEQLKSCDKCEHPNQCDHCHNHEHPKLEYPQPERPKLEYPQPERPKPEHPKNLEHPKKPEPEHSLCDQCRQPDRCEHCHDYKPKYERPKLCDNCHAHGHDHDKPDHEQPEPEYLPCDKCHHPDKCDHCHNENKPEPKPCDECEYPSDCGHCSALWLEPSVMELGALISCDQCRYPHHCDHCYQPWPTPESDKTKIELTPCNTCAYPNNCNHCHHYDMAAVPVYEAVAEVTELIPCDKCQYPQNCDHCQSRSGLLYVTSAPPKSDIGESEGVIPEDAITSITENTSEIEAE